MLLPDFLVCVLSVGIVILIGRLHSRETYRRRR